MTIMTKNNQHQQTHYEVLETLPKLQILSMYTKSIFIGLWILMKWFVYLLWSYVIYGGSNNNNNNRSNSNDRKNNTSSSSRLQQSKNENDDCYNDNYEDIYYDGDSVYHHTKPPSILIDNKIGRHSYVKLKNVKFHYVEAGKPKNPLILLLHGFPDCWLGWRNQIQELSRFFHVVALDMKGFNDSDKPIWRQVYTPKQICEELRLFIHSLGYHNLTIIGHDIGAIIGWFFAYTNPNNIEKFICVSSSHPNIAWNTLYPKSIINNSWLHFVQMPLLPELDHSSSHSKFLDNCLKPIQQSMNKNLKNSKTSVISFREKIPITSINTMMTAGGGGGSGSSATIANRNDYETIIYSDRDYSFSIIDTYKYVFNRRADWTGPFNYYRNFPFYRIKEGNNVRCPVLIVTGNADEICSLESIIKSTDYCDNFIVKIIEGAGHWPHQQQPIEFNKVILNFLVGRRAQPEQHQLEKHTSKSIVGSLFGAAVTQSVKIGTSVLDSVQQHTNNLRSSIQQQVSGISSTSSNSSNNNSNNKNFNRGVDTIGDGGGISGIIGTENCEENDPFF